MHGRVIATEITEKKFDISIQTTVEHVLAQRSKENVNRPAQVIKINEHVSVNTAEAGSFSRRMP